MGSISRRAMRSNARGISLSSARINKYLRRKMMLILARKYLCVPLISSYVSRSTNVKREPPFRFFYFSFVAASRRYTRDASSRNSSVARKQTPLFNAPFGFVSVRAEKIFRRALDLKATTAAMTIHGASSPLSSALSHHRSD